MTPLIARFSLILLLAFFVGAMVWVWRVTGRD
jgi:hypothetical protein